jgi:hypothetical protein
LTWEDERRHNYDHHYSSSIAIKPNSSNHNNNNNINNNINDNNNVIRQTELDPDVSVIPLRRTLHSSSSGLPDLTVYF